MPFAVNCPLCGLDGTAKANVILQEKLSGQTAAALPPPPPPPLSTQQPKLRIGGTSGSTTAPPAIAPPPPIAPRPMTAGGGIRPLGAAAPPAEKGNFTLGIVGAVAGGIVGMLIWYFIHKATGLRLGILALGVGALTGFGSKWLGRCHSTSMGLVTAGCALLCIFGAQYMKARSMWHTDEKLIDQAYDEEMTEAKKMIAEIPNGSDDEIRRYLLKEWRPRANDPIRARLPRRRSRHITTGCGRK
jgi:hypothetical protein